MKTVEMMKKAIKESAQSDYKWTANKDGLHWDYLNVEFKFEIFSEGDAYGFGFVNQESGVRAMTWLIPEVDYWVVEPDNYDFFKEDDKEAAIFWAAKKVIEKAEYLF